MLHPYRIFGILVGFCVVLRVIQIVVAQDRAKDNGDIYVVNVTKLEGNLLNVNNNSDDNAKSMLLTTVSTLTDNEKKTKENNNFVDMESVTRLCNESFSIPMDYIVQFNTTSELPDVVDKTGMCFIRCFYEKSGLIDNWVLNADKIRANMWPATGDTIEVCQQERNTEPNACVRAYAIAKCLTIRALVDARNNPVV